MSYSPSIPIIQSPNFIYFNSNENVNSQKIINNKKIFKKASIPSEFEVENGIVGLGEFVILLIIRFIGNLEVVRNVFFFFYSSSRVFYCVKANWFLP
jgi:hypothetical protein